MKNNPLYYQLGRFVVQFQHLESSLTHLVVVMARADDEIIRILVNNLDFISRVKTTDILFSYFVDRLKPTASNEKNKFHKLMSECIQLGELRNDLLHSRYAHVIEGPAVVALVRENSKLKASAGQRKIEIVRMDTDSFEPYFERLNSAVFTVKEFHFKILEWNSLT